MVNSFHSFKRLIFEHSIIVNAQSKRLTNFKRLQPCEGPFT